MIHEVLDNGRFRVALGTWFFKLLTDAEPGGLPADFFSHAASMLLVCDEVYCDQEAFDSEMDFAGARRDRGKFLSSKLYKDLYENGILKPLPYREIFADTIKLYQEQGLGEAVSEAMALRRQAILDGTRGKALQLDPALTKVNDLFLLELGAKGYLPYGWGNKSLQSLRYAAATPASQTPPTREILGLTAMSISLPHIPVLLDPKAVKAIDNDAYLAYRENLKKEQIPLALWMNNDPEWGRERYNHMRSGSSFRSGDSLFDGVRERSAMKNMEKILKIRSETKNERRELQSYLTVAVNGGLSISKVRADVSQCEIRYQELVEPTKDRLRIDAVLTAAGALSAITSTAIDALAVTIPGLVASTLGVGMMARTTSARKRARLEEPVGYLFSRVRKAKSLHTRGA